MDEKNLNDQEISNGQDGADGQGGQSSQGGQNGKDSQSGQKSQEVQIQLKAMNKGVWWYMPIILTLGSWKEEDGRFRPSWALLISSISK